MMEVAVLAKNDMETGVVAGKLARACLGARPKKALIIGLIGDLGGGKTTFTKSFAVALGVKERVTSPTFVIQKIFKLRGKHFKHLIHIDAYRLESPRELEILGWHEIAADPKNIIIVEWADKIKKILPGDALYIYFKVVSSRAREIKITVNATLKK